MSDEDEEQGLGVIKEEPVVSSVMPDWQIKAVYKNKLAREVKKIEGKEP